MMMKWIYIKNNYVQKFDRILKYKVDTELSDGVLYFCLFMSLAVSNKVVWG